MKERPTTALANDPVDKLYTTTYVAELFSVTSETVRNWIERGELEGVRIGRQWRVPRRALIAFANSRYGG